MAHAYGTIASYDPDEEAGNIHPENDKDDETIAFDLKEVKDTHEKGEPRTGERVRYDVEGGMAGLAAVDIHRV